MTELTIRPVITPADREIFIRLPWSLYANDPAWVPPLLMDRRELLDSAKNPYFEHAEVALWIAERGGVPIGRISAQVDQLVQKHMGDGTGQWGFFEVGDDAEAASALIATAEVWLRTKRMTRALGPFSLSVWDEPGLLIDGFATKPLLMMGHHKPTYRGLIEAAGYAKARDLYAYDLDITKSVPERIKRIVAAGDANPRIRLRPVDLARFDQEVALILDILNDAWSDNWGYIPLTPAEIAHAAKSLKAIVKPQMVRIAEYDGEPLAFMITLPNLNEYIADLDGKLFPFGWAKLLYRLKYGHSQRVRVPLMGVRKAHQTSRHGALMVFMLIEHIRRYTNQVFGAKRGELSWILEDNTGMRTILEALGCTVYKTYRIFEKPL
jgi:hypothetical protein